MDQSFTIKDTMFGSESIGRHYHFYFIIERKENILVLWLGIYANKLMLSSCKTKTEKSTCN